MKLVLAELRKFPCGDSVVVDTHASPFLGGKKPDVSLLNRALASARAEG